jgi:hypothetical protein
MEKDMKSCIGSKATWKPEKILFMSICLVLLWTNSAQAFKAVGVTKHYHKTITYDGIESVSQIIENRGTQQIKFTHNAIGEIQRFVRKVDSDSFFGVFGGGEFLKAKAHCDAEELLQCSHRIKDLRDDITELLTTKPLPRDAGSKARQLLGRALHTVQDYYSHSNWIERGNTTINLSLLGVDLLPDSEIPPSPLAPVLPACKQQFRIHQPSGERIANGSEILNLKLYATSGFWVDGKTCEIPADHPGRCVHGDGCSGIGKDSPGQVPQGVLHHETAADLATKATTEFVQQIVNELRDNGSDEGTCAFMGVERCIAANFEVTPAMNFSSTGPIRGPFSPHNSSYTIKNVGNGPLEIFVAISQGSWVTLRNNTFRLEPGQATQVFIDINPNADLLGPGGHNETIYFNLIFDTIRDGLNDLILRDARTAFLNVEPSACPCSLENVGWFDKVEHPFEREACSIWRDETAVTFHEIRVAFKTPARPNNILDLLVSSDGTCRWSTGWNGGYGNIGSIQGSQRIDTEAQHDACIKLFTNPGAARACVP